MSAPETPSFICSCLPLNRRLMAHLLKVDEGSVHEQGCVERAASEAIAMERARIVAAVKTVPGNGHWTERMRRAVLAIIEPPE